MEGGERKILERSKRTQQEIKQMQEYTSWLRLMAEAFTPEWSKVIHTRVIDGNVLSSLSVFRDFYQAKLYFR